MTNSATIQASSGQNQLFRQVHLSDYLAILVKRKWIIFFTFLILVGLVGLYSFFTTPVYNATAQILIQAPSSPMKGVGEIDISKKQGREDYLQVIYQLLVSKEVAREVAERANVHFGWANNAPLIPGDPPLDSSKPFYTAEQHINSLRVTPIQGFGIIGISIFNQSPTAAAWLVNLHSEVFIEKYRQENKRQVQEKFIWFTRQIKEQKEKVTQSYQELYKYQKDNGLVSHLKDSNIVQQKLMALNKSLIEATAEKKAKEAVYQELIKYTNNSQVLFSIPAIANDRVITELRSEQLHIRQEKAEMSAVYGVKHFKMIELGKKSTHLTQQLNKEVKRVLQLGKEEVDHATFLEEIARKALEAQKQTAINLKKESIQYDMLQREADSSQAIYDTLLAQSKQVNLSSMFERDNIYLTERALPPRRPAKPKKALNILLAIILSSFLGSCLAFLVEYMNKKVSTPEDVARYLHLPVLGVLPYEKNYSKETILTSGTLIGGPPPKDSYSYPYLHVLDWLPEELHLGQPGESASVLLMASTVLGEGKTTILAKIGARLGKAGFRVLAADCDFQRPTLHTFFTKDKPIGFGDALQKISEVDISAGQLNQCSVGDLYTLIELRKLSGRLTTINKYQRMMSLFQNGRLLNVESGGAVKANRLGAMLKKSGFLTENQLQEALDRSSRTSLPFGYILINSGFITQEQLQGHLKLQTEEHLQKLFSWKTGSYTFEAKSIRNYENEKLYFEEDYSAIIARQSKLAGNLLFEENIRSLVHETDYENVSFITAGRVRPAPGDPVNLRLLNIFIDNFRNSYDLILLDAPPILEAADSAALAQLADGVVFVVKSNQLNYPVLHQAIQRIAATNTEILGTVLNQVKEKDLIG